jgi:predicted DCC family thiol-disulfide oxidoreductase YuxK
LSPANDPAAPVLLYDGVCGLCNRLVQFSLHHDVQGRLRFAPLQSDFAARIMSRHDINPLDLDTVYFVEACGQPEERLSVRSDAIISLLRHIGGGWSVAAAMLRFLPRWFREWGYKIVARNRYRIFGRSDSCLLPEKKYQDRFLAM